MASRKHGAAAVAFAPAPAVALALALALAACAQAPNAPSPVAAAPGGQPGATTSASPAPASAPGATVPAARAIALSNPGFESSQPGILGAPDGWIAFQHAGAPSYAFTLDGVTAHSGAKSLRIDNVGPEVYGAVAQRIPAATLRGATLRYSVWMRTAKVTGGGLVAGAGPTLAALRGGSPMASADDAAAMLVGTHEWVRRELTLAVPANADAVEVGVILGGPGTVWFDDAELVLLTPAKS